METLEKQIGARLRQRREELNLTQGEVASKMSVAVTTVQRLENSETQPRIDTLVAYCKAVGAKLDDITGETSEPTPVRLPSNGEILNVVKNALKVAEIPLIKRILDCSKEEQEEIAKRLDMIEHRRKLSKPVSKFAKK